MTSPLVSGGWLHATVPIDNPYGESGTGFLVARVVAPGESRIFLVTNKHVVCKDAAQRKITPFVVCHFNTKELDGSQGKVSGQLPLNFDDGNSRYREHPDIDTDVAVFDVTDLMVLNSNFDKRWIDYKAFGIESKRNELDITAGEEIVTIGYPIGLRQGDTNFPLIRQGMIATKIGTKIKDQIQSPDGTLRPREMRAFLIDGATVPGSSGSPVLLKPVIGRIQGNDINLGNSQIVLLGIVAETKYAPVQFGNIAIPGFAGLGMAFIAETIIETIELFFNPT